MRYSKFLKLLVATFLLVACGHDTLSSVSDGFVDSSLPVSSEDSSSVDTSESESLSSSEEIIDSSSESVVSGISSILFNYITSLPDMNAFLPDFMDHDTYLTPLEVNDLDYYASSINKSNLPNTYFGEQLNQLWTHVGYADTFTSSIKTMLTSTATLGNLYNTYLSGSPSDPYMFTTSIGGFSFLVTGLSNELIVSVDVGSTSVTMAVIDIDGLITYWVDIFVNNDNRLLIYSTTTNLHIIGNIEVFGVKISYLLEIEKVGNEIVGYSYERYGIGDMALRSHVVFKTEGDYFTIAGEKGDFIIGASPKLNVETYNLTTGQFLGSKVLETIPFTGPTYETVWYPMWHISGWTSILFEEDNDDEKDFPQVYLNGSSTEFFVHYNTVPLIGKTSRKYDIELRKIYVFVEDGEGNLSKILFQYPAFFIQSNEITTDKPFGTANEHNNNVFTHTLTTAQQNAIQNFYTDMKVRYDNYKQVDVDSYISNFLSSIAQ
jgi:hypothetical protein